MLTPTTSPIKTGKGGTHTLGDAKVDADLVVETVRQELPTWTLARMEGTPVRLLPAGAVIVGIRTVDAGDLDAGLAAESRIVGDIGILVVGRHADLVQRGDNIVEDSAGHQLRVSWFCRLGRD